MRTASSSRARCESTSSSIVPRRVPSRTSLANFAVFSNLARLSNLSRISIGKQKDKD
jgi:hypothetical protein